ncbi:nucleoside-diphosphate-sugar epimerase [Archangium gephyra]|uniref:Dihydroflavonol-4-reductase n=1 Tax=Archangium gephyra TaxID=48 RepID=A0AAC8Q0I4_9BACT|nr:SDR family oxidoreductase [Archangium gephyra]AKI98753.1 Dihydroflavonol-4-reductase [Archangium gephyra]REG30673.1 nucleoside-diphosphate-sugar epimerase [Archangium gephyra]
MKTAFVTGSTGLLGNNLVRLLTSRGVRVKALVRSPERARKLLAGVPVELVQGDLEYVASFAPALRDTDVLFHTAAYFRDSYKGGSHDAGLLRINVGGTRDLLEAAYQQGVRRVVHTSSIAVLAPRPGHPLTDETMRREAQGEPDAYYRSKILADREVDAALERHPDLQASLVLPGFMNGPGDAGPTTAGQLVLDFLHGRLPGVINTRFAYVDARDVAAALVAAADKGLRGERYLAAGRDLHVGEALAVLSAVTGLPAPGRRVPDALLGTLALLNEAWARLSRRPVLVSWQGFRTLRRERTNTAFDSSKAERALGLRFRPLEETFRDAVEWFATHGYVDRARLPRSVGSLAVPPVPRVS